MSTGDRLPVTDELKLETNDGAQDLGMFVKPAITYTPCVLSIFRSLILKKNGPKNKFPDDALKEIVFGVIPFVDSNDMDAVLATCVNLK